MKMYPDDWRVRLTTAVGVAVCMAAAMMLGPVVGIEGFLPGGLAIIVAIIVGIVLGQLGARPRITRCVPIALLCSCLGSPLGSRGLLAGPHPPLGAHR